MRTKEGGSTGQATGLQQIHRLALAGPAPAGKRSGGTPAGQTEGATRIHDCRHATTIQ